MAKGKYADVIDSLPRYNGNDPTYQEKVAAVKQAILAEAPENRYASNVAQRYTEIRAEKDAVEEVLKEIQLRLDATSQLLVETYENEGITSMKLGTGTSVRFQQEPHAVVINAEMLRQWAITNGLEKSLQLPWQTTNKLTKEALLEGENEPDGVVAFAKDKIVMTK
jgi:hypothetical protein